MKGVRPLEAMPRTTSFLVGLRRDISWRPSFGVVFADFGGGGEGFGASGDDEVRSRIGVEGGRALDGVEGGDAAAGSGADVDEASAAAESGGDLIDGAGDLGQGAGYGGGDGGVFGVDQVRDFEGGFAVEIVGGLVGLFGAEAAEFAFQVGAFRDWACSF